MNYKIVKATKADLPQIQEMGRSVVDDYERTHLGDEVVDGYIGSGACDADFAKHLDNTQLLLLDKVAIGLIIWIDNRLQGFLIDIPYWGIGAAQHLLTETLRERFEHYDEVYLECFESSPRANAFYTKMGWERGECIESDSLRLVIYRKRR